MGCRRENNAAALASRISADCHAAASLVSFNVPDSLQAALIIGGGTGYLCAINARMTAWLLAPMALLCAISVPCAPVADANTLTSLQCARHMHRMFERVRFVFAATCRPIKHQS